LMGAKLHPSPIAYRVYAPSTHSLPVIKCVSGVDGYAEVELTSCHGNGIYRLKDLSPLYQRIWNSKTETAADKVTLKDKFRRTFSVVCYCAITLLAASESLKLTSFSYIRHPMTPSSGTYDHSISIRNGAQLSKSSLSEEGVSGCLPADPKRQENRHSIDIS